MQNRRNTMQEEGYELLSSFKNQEGVLTNIYRPNTKVDDSNAGSPASDSWFNSPEELGTFGGFMKDSFIGGCQLLRLGLFWSVRKIGLGLFLGLEFFCRILLLCFVSAKRQFQVNRPRQYEDNYGSRRRTTKPSNRTNDNRIINIFVTNNFEL